MFSSLCRNTDQFLILNSNLLSKCLQYYFFSPVFSLFRDLFHNLSSKFQEVFSKKELPYPEVENTIILQLGTVPETEKIKRERYHQGK
jgi:hypothetical protein